MLDKGRVFIRNLLSVFEKVDGERSNCPRCEGSGLLDCKKFWSWNRTTSSNKPCWFCEGIGVMPLYGLHGFLLGRASAAFRTEDLKKPADPPIKLQLCLGKYPDTKCKLRSFKPSNKMQELLYDRSKIPLWLTDAVEELAATTVAVNSGYFDEDMDLIVSDPGEESEISHTVALRSSPIPPLDPFRLLYHFDHDVKVDKVNLADSPAQFNIMDWNASIERGQRGICAGKVKDERVAVPFHDRVSASMLKSNQTITDNPSIRRQTHGEETMRDLRKSISISRRTRLMRQNHIRVKAERESIQRALWTQRLKPSNREESQSTTPSDQSGSLWSFSATWKELSSKWLAEETALARESSQSSKLEAEKAPNLPSAKRMLFARLVDKLPFLPSFVNLPFKC